MDSFFGIGAPELILILLLAGIVMGPERIGQVARWLGKTTAQLQAISRQFMRQLNAELTAADQGEELKGAMDDIKALQRQVMQLREELKGTVRKPFEDGRTAVNESRQMISDTAKMLQTPVAPADKQNVPIEGNKIAPLPDPDRPLPNLIDVPDDPE
jgi:Sec-independent protein translocase protein TatA